MHVVLLCFFLADFLSLVVLHVLDELAAGVIGFFFLFRRLFREGELMLRRSLADGPQMQLDRTTGAATAIAKGVPLKYCAGNQKVSWDKRNNVTGTKIYAARIGSKNAGQSEWEDVGDGTGR